ncbi:MAG: hypothetical protein J6D31_02065 [Clostridia bacterium]|nr:hypothetical protein [Clostridia bacterium]
MKERKQEELTKTAEAVAETETKAEEAEAKAAESATVEETEAEAAEKPAEEEAEEEAGEAISQGAREAFAAFLSALSPQDKQVLCAVLGRLQDYERARAEQARAAAEAACLLEMEREPAFAGIREQVDRMQALISRLPWLQALPVRERLETACYMDRGMRWHAPTPQEKLEALLSDPALMRALAERQAALRQAQEKTTPPVRAGAGLSPATAVAKPKSLGEAKQAAKRFLRA